MTSGSSTPQQSRSPAALRRIAARAEALGDEKTAERFRAVANLKEKRAAERSVPPLTLNITPSRTFQKAMDDTPPPAPASQSTPLAPPSPLKNEPPDATFIVHPEVESLLAGVGWKPKEIAGMAPIAPAAGLPPKPGLPPAGVSPDDYAMLTTAGYEDEDIADMDPSEVAYNVEDATNQGYVAGEPPTRRSPAAPVAPPPTTGAPPSVPANPPQSTADQSEPLSDWGAREWADAIVSRLRGSKPSIYRRMKDAFGRTLKAGYHPNDVYGYYVWYGYSHHFEPRFFYPAPM